MKVALVLFSCFVALIVSQIPDSDSETIKDEEIDKAFESFKKKYEKVYKSPEEEKARKNEYRKCLILIKNHNKDFEKGKVTFRLKENKFCDAFESEKAPLSSGILQSEHDFEFEESMVRGKSGGVTAGVKEKIY